jgi:predicted RNase H-like nuclease (RuvC/YqgF family)
MLKVVDASINSLPYPVVSPTDTSILNHVLAELQTLRSEVQELRGQRDKDLEEIEALKVKLETLEGQELQDIDRICIDIAHDRQRISRLENKPLSEDSPLLDDLYKEMKAIGRKQVDFATAARMLKRSKSRLFQLKAAIAIDQRFVLIPSESHSQKLLIRLREFYKPV